MEDQNKHNLVYFEASSMRKLYDSMENWQNENQKRLLSITTQEDGGQFCCIALTNPTEVVITDGAGRYSAHVDHDGLNVYVSNMQ